MPDFRAISVIVSDPCCAAAQTLKDQRHLVMKTPKLPLPDCTMPQGCKCRYQKHSDRRETDEDRRLIGSTMNSIWNAEAANRRKKPSKRSGDKDK